MTAEFWKKNLKEASQVLELFMQSDVMMAECVHFSKVLTEAYQTNKNIFICGNGGSHCDSMHFAEELTGRYRKNRRPLGALALGDASHVTCVSNDYGFEYIFSRQLEALAKPGDVCIGLSTSGNSKNVINAIQYANKNSIKTIGLLGKDGGELKNIVNIPIIVPAETSDRIQEVHIKIIHIVIESMERELFPENYT